MPKSITSVLNQPIKYFESNQADNCKCGDVRQCVLVQAGQQVYSQLKIEPCGEVEVCNNSIGPNLVTNGTFAGNLDDWTVDAGWAYSSGKACATNGQNIGQAIAGNLIDGDPYLVVFTISNYDSNDLTVSLGGTSSGPYNADGTYMVVIVAGASDESLIFGGSSTFNACIDDIELYHITSCWDADESDWTTSATGACHAKGNTTDLTNTGTTITSGLYYHVTIAVSGSSIGGINIVLGTNVISPLTSGNGIFHFWGTSNGTQLSVRPTTDFDGCILDLDIDEYCTDYKFHLLPASGDEFVIVDMTPYYTLTEDVYNLTDFIFSDIFIGDSHAGSIPLPFGCYKLCLVDCCTAQQTLPSLLLNYDFSSQGQYWAFQNVTFDFGKAIFDLTHGVAFIQQPLISTSDADCIQIEFEYLSEANDIPIQIYIDGVLVDSLNIGGSGTYTNTFSDVPAGAIIKIASPADLLVPLYLDNIVITIPEECKPLYDQCTPCINYQADFSCTKLVEAYCKSNALGFAFDDANGNNQFKLSQLVRAELLHPSYEQEQDDYDYSTGTTSLSFGQNKKFQALTFHPIPEFKHDVIALQKICDTFQINTADYFVKKGDYTPEWNRGTNTDLAPSRIDVKKKDQTLYNTNCS